jgi:methylated-DNA-protein-cysteine methyltransferase-like protein
VKSFAEQVYDIVALIPEGKVTSYGHIARMLGKPRGAREVGWAMSNCPEGLPWQRVVMADGGIAGGGFAEMRRELLEGEGVVFTIGGKVDMKECFWNG